MNFKSRIIIGCLLGACTLQVSAEKTYKYRINLRDKAETAYSVGSPQAYLSERALERRERQGLKVDETDLPVCRTYIDAIIGKGASVVTKSKWNNTVVVEVVDTTLIEQIARLPFVTKTKKEGMQIAVIDAGFYNADEMKFFKKMHLLGIRDFVNPQSDIYAENYHGMKVLSCLAANQPDVLVGTAPEASYWLLRSEDDDTEQPVEEDYWAAALEFADSVGVDVVNTSLGYYEFDDKTCNYRYRDLDGHYSLMSHSASMAADKGLVVVCSAGNSGRGTWKKLTPPGDAENVITVGAMDKNLVNADFSSVGNTADGRVKPDVMAVGVSSAVAGNDGTVSRANGTSFASPTFCGLVACFWQACPWLTAKEVIEAVRRSADRADAPDNIYGYGVSNIWKAYQTELKKRK